MSPRSMPRSREKSKIYLLDLTVGYKEKAGRQGAAERFR
jgi:hypothetical protein